MKIRFNQIKKYINKYKTLTIVISIIIFATFITLIMIRHGLMRGHDLTFHLSRIKGLKESIALGDYKALIHPGLYGYGYANGLFYGNIFIYIPAILNLLGISLCRSYVIFMWLVNVFSGLTMFYTVKKISKSTLAGFISASIYICAAYRVCDVVLRAAVGEMLAFMVIPIIILGLYEIIYNDYKKWYIFSIGFVLLVQAHIISAVVMAIVSLILILINVWRFIDEKSRIKYLIISTVIGMLIGAYFIFPLLEQYIFSELLINNLKTTSSIGSTALPIERLFFGISYYSTATFYPPGIGIIFIIITCLRFKIKNKNKKLLKLTDTFLITGLVLLISITGFFPWKELSKYLGFMQFSWRLYLFATVFLSVASGMIIYLYCQNKQINKKKIVCYILIFITISCYINIHYSIYAIRNYWGVPGMEYISGYDDYYIGTGEYLPYKTDINKLEKRGEKVTSNNSDLKIKYYKQGNKIIVNYSNNLKDNTYIEVPLLYYLGYVANSKKNIYKIKPGDNNVIRIFLTGKTDKVMIYYKGTMVQRIAYYISLLSLFSLLILSIRRRWFYGKKK